GDEVDRLARVPEHLRLASRVQADPVHRAVMRPGRRRGDRLGLAAVGNDVEWRSAAEDGDRVIGHDRSVPTTVKSQNDARRGTMSVTMRAPDGPARTPCSTPPEITDQLPATSLDVSPAAVSSISPSATSVICSSGWWCNGNKASASKLYSFTVAPQPSK